MENSLLLQNRRKSNLRVRNEAGHSDPDDDDDDHHIYDPQCVIVRFDYVLTLFFYLIFQLIFGKFLKS